MIIRIKQPDGTWKEIASNNGKDGRDGTDGAPGQDGNDGVGIQDISITPTSIGTNVSFILTNGHSRTFHVNNGKDGIDGISLGESPLVHEIGESATSVMSQKAITEAIKHNVHITRGTCWNMGSVTAYKPLKLTEKQIELLNKTDVISLHFVTRGTGDGGSDYRYFRVYSPGGGFDLKFDYSRHVYLQTNGTTPTSSYLNMLNTTTPIVPDVWTVVINRVTGEVKYYASDTLINTVVTDVAKVDNFIGSTGYLIIHPADNDVRIYDFAVYDDDITDYFLESSSYNDERNADGALSVLYKFANYQKTNGEYNQQTLSTYSGTGTGWTFSQDSTTGVRTYTLTTAGATSTPCPAYYSGPTDIAARVRDTIVVSGGVVRIEPRPGVKELKLYNAETMEQLDNMEIGDGTYVVEIPSSKVGRYNFRLVSGEVGMTVQHIKNSYKYSTCVVHPKCDTLYGGQLYDDQADYFYPLKADCPEYKNNTYVRDPQLASMKLRVILRSSTNVNVHYIGEMIIQNGKIQMATDWTTWKQINNT